MSKNMINKFLLRLMIFIFVLALGLPVGNRIDADTAGVYEAEAVGNTLSGNAVVSGCGACSGGQKVGGLYQGASLQFNHVTVQTSGIYKVTVYYTSGDPRSANISVNGGEKNYYNFPATTDWNTVGSYDVTLNLNAGSNTILIDDNNWYAPDIDRIVIGELQNNTSNGVYEAEAAGNTLLGNASVSECGACSDGHKVGGLYQGSSLQLNHVTVQTSGSYKVTVYYISGDPRSANISVNGGGKNYVNFPATVDWNTVGSYDVTLNLNAGSNTILIDDNNWYAPDIDRIVVGGLQNIPSNGVYEAETAGNTLLGNASVTGCGACSGGQKVGALYQGSSLQFNHVTVQTSGSYKVTVYYISGDPRSANISVNGVAKNYVNFPATPDWNTVGSYDVIVDLNAGSNTILIDDSNWYAPDIDRIVVQAINGTIDPGADEGAIGIPLSPVNYKTITVTPYTSGMKVSNGQYTVTYHSGTGFADYQWNNGQQFMGAYGKIKMNGEELKTIDYPSHSVSLEQIVPLNDHFGTGIEVVFTHTEEGKPTLRQVYDFYEGKSYFLARLDAVSGQPFSTNYMAPVAVNRAGGVTTGQTADNRILNVPFDNDMWIRYAAKTLNQTDTSYEVTAIYDNASRQGLIIGSVTHDNWKTGIDWSGLFNQLNQLTIYGGASSNITHDSQPHGSLTGTQVSSPTILIGGFADYREGLEAYGRANAVITPTRSLDSALPQGVPVGWNSWGGIGYTLTYQNIVDTSNYFKTHLPTFNHNGAVYINTDAHGAQLTEEQLEQAVSVIHANGQQAGVYWAPFTYWGEDLNQPVEGTNDQYKYKDIVLKDNSGNPLPKLDGAFAIDPTHPGAKQMFAYYVNRFKQIGYSYVKLDFLSHGALEGTHADPNVTTGIQAYNVGMRYISDVLDGKLFVSESIAPLFPAQYANSRRIATDTFGSIHDSEYELNALTYGWWQNATIYNFTDPDHVALTHAGSLTEARSRLNSAVISGTVLLDGDDVNNPVAQDYMAQLYSNPKVIELATKGKAFRPVEGNTGANATDTFVKQDGNDYYLAVFNYSGNSSTAKTIDLARAGLPAETAYSVEDLWTGQVSATSGTFQLALQPAESKLFKLTQEVPLMTTAVVAPSQPDGLNGWYINPVTVSLSATDNLSGVAKTEYSLDGGKEWKNYTGAIIFNQDNKYMMSYRSTDKAGNVEAPQTLSFNLDMIAPAITINGLVGGTYSDSVDMTPTILLSDDLSGIDSSKSTVTLDTYGVEQDKPIPLYTLPLGSHSFIVTASDQAGNVGNKTITFQTTTDVESLQTLVSRFTNAGWIDNAGISNSLKSKLTANNLVEFVNELKAQSGKHISTQAAYYLLRDVQYLLSQK
ncbi:OmpL47-type beta-barrel domain-containing protein [Paenibacillus aestuarii]|uniref:OmpL47-type beta-barrel domain-containing protein n=1 Tax=Paenibacillus aestuarii TaxID=516965 RepID=A0ABW0KDY4_9BACL|nr:carbohydrate-binding domain-containing protein [Paenibacillus aestuarii]